MSKKRKKRNTVTPTEKPTENMPKKSPTKMFAGFHPLVGSASVVTLLLIAVIVLFTAGGSVKGAAVSAAIAHPNNFEPIELLNDSHGIESNFNATDPHENIRSSSIADEQIMQFVMSDMSALNYGMTDERVNTLQCRLDELGYLNIDELTEYFGPATHSAVKAFQRQSSLAQTGNADSATLTLLFSAEANEYALCEGTRGGDVSSMQLQLADLAYIDKVTGYYGEQTTAAVKEFQQRNKLYVSGVADKQTIELLYSADAVPSTTYESQARRRAKISTFVSIAKAQLGKRYVSGATGPNSYDCSGLVYYALHQAGSNRRRLSAQGYSQVSDWEKITSMSNLQIGDLLFFKNYRGSSRVGHVGIYIGGGNMVDASSSQGKIVIRSCMAKHWRALFVCARRPW